MLDILPASPQRGDRKRSSAKKSAAGVVQLTWKLPARLRRPVRSRRRARRSSDNPVQFERRPILSEVPSSLPPRRTVEQSPQALGAEQHTADVYRYSRPEVALPLPPYKGHYRGSSQSVSRLRAARSFSARTHQSFSKPARVSTARTDEVRDNSVAFRKRSLPKKSPETDVGTVAGVLQDSVVLGGERDLPFQWGGADQKQVPDPAAPSPAFFSPVDDVDTGESFSTTPSRDDATPSPETLVAGGVVLPRSRLSLPRRLSNSPSRLIEYCSSVFYRLFSSVAFIFAPLRHGRSYLNLVLLIVGCGAILAVVWQLQHVGAGFRVLDSLVQRANLAYEHIATAQSALAETNFTDSEQAFGDARQQLLDARQELDAALASSEVVLRYLDVTGTVRSGQELLTAGEALTEAGEHVSRGLAPLFATTVSLAGDDQDATVVDALQQAQVELVSALSLLDTATTALDDVRSPLLPSDIADRVTELKDALPRIRSGVSSFVEQSSFVLALLGVEREQQYLLLFENNHELRPTGGFIGTFALVDVDRGVVENIDVRSIYDPDGQLKEFISPPDPLSRVTPRWYMRDANWFVDYSVSAGKIADFFEKEGGPTVDGVIAFTPEVIRNLLEVTGPVDVPSFDEVVTADTFTQVAQAQVTYEYDKELNQPKQFLSDLTPLLLQRLFALPPEKTLSVLQALEHAAHQKQLLLYFRDDALQERVEESGWAGVFPQDRQGFLAVNTANIGGHKSDQFVDQEIDYRLTVLDSGDVDAVVMIRRTHHGPSEVLDYEYPKDENPAFKDNVVYQRVFVPGSARLLEARGFTPLAELPAGVPPEVGVALVPDPDVAEWQRAQSLHSTGTSVGKEAGYTFFANWLVTAPGEVSVAFYHYVIPGHAALPNFFDPAKGFQAYVAKQPGETRTRVRVELSLPDDMHIDHVLPESGITRENDTTVVYRTPLDRDAFVGVVYEKQ